MSVKSTNTLSLCSLRLGLNLLAPTRRDEGEAKPLKTTLHAVLGHACLAMVLLSDSCALRETLMEPSLTPSSRRVERAKTLVCKKRLGRDVGRRVGWPVGAETGCAEGCLEGCPLGCLVGCVLGRLLGRCVGCPEGWPEGRVGTIEGCLLGCPLG